MSRDFLNWIARPRRGYSARVEAGALWLRIVSGVRIMDDVVDLRLLVAARDWRGAVAATLRRMRAQVRAERAAVRQVSMRPDLDAVFRGLEPRPGIRFEGGDEIIRHPTRGGET